MKPSQFKQLINVRIDSGIKRPVMVLGQPGIGKTQCLQQVAREREMACIVIHGPSMQPEDLSLPVVAADRKSVNFLLPTSRLPIVGDDRTPEEGILVIDELSQSEPAIQKATAQIIQEREYHGHKIKPGWHIFATGNRVKDRAGANRLLSHLVNRMTVVELSPDLNDWCEYYMQHEDFKPECLAFIRFRPGSLANFDPQRDVNPSPRAWVEGVFRTVGLLPSDCELEAWTGDVGEGEAVEFMSFLRTYRDLPNIDDVLAAPDKHPVPKEPSVLYALSGALAHHSTAKNFANVLKFANRMPQEFLVVILRTVARKPEIQQCAAFMRWMQTDGIKVLG